MNDTRDFERAVDRWLDDGSDSTPPHVIDAVLLAARSTPQERDLRLLWRTPFMTAYLPIAAVIAMVSLAGLGAFFALGYGTNLGAGPNPSPTAHPTLTPSLTVPSLLGPDPVSVERMTVIRQHVDAINARDTGAFIDAFQPGANFGPGGDFRDSSSVFGNSLPLANASLVDAWMAINDAWDFEAEILACNQDPGAAMVRGTGGDIGEPMVVNCEVATRWHSLSTEITERWYYEIRGSSLAYWDFGLFDLNPRERALPLGYDGLEAWEAWLEATHPASAARYLNPRSSEWTCDGCSEWLESLAPGDPERAARLAPLLSNAENDWSIQGQEFSPHGLIPYDPAHADEIEASIQDYLEEIQS